MLSSCQAHGQIVPPMGCWTGSFWHASHQLNLQTISDILEDPEERDTIIEMFLLWLWVRQNLQYSYINTRCFKIHIVKNGSQILLSRYMHLGSVLSPKVCMESWWFFYLVDWIGRCYLFFTTALIFPCRTFVAVRLVSHIKQQIVSIRTNKRLPASLHGKMLWWWGQQGVASGLLVRG